MNYDLIIIDNLSSDFVYYIDDYVILLMWVISSCVLVLILWGISSVLIIQNSDEENISSYECGFQPFDDMRQNFDINYYLVAILFIVFDLEIMFLVPWVQVFQYIGLFGMVIAGFFLVVLTIGFYYEISKDVLKWS